ncbi:SiaB family protein kinase, partial [Thiotrichales bacterium HSG1]|nr:SiaB family protein kinase [Thiotrichales bacterium HSG1]
VSCGNMVHNEAVDSIRKQLTRLQVMNKDELKRYYRERRREDIPKDSKGAGLGFIELARKSVKPIEFEVQKIDDNYSFFSLKTTI